MCTPLYTINIYLLILRVLIIDQKPKVNFVQELDMDSPCKGK